MLWTRPEREAWPVTLGGTPVITSNWRTWMANFLRWNGWTEEVDFAWWDAEEGDDYPSGVAGEVRHEARPSNEYPWYFDTGSAILTFGELTWLGVDPRTYTSGDNLALQYQGNLIYSGAPPDPSVFPITVADLVAILEEDEEVGTYDFSAYPSLSRIGGSAYLEFRLYNSETDIIRGYAAKINVSRLDQGEAGDAVWISQLYTHVAESVEVAPGDLIHVKLPDSEESPVERLAWFWRADVLDEFGEPTGDTEGRCGYLDAITGDSVESFVLPDCFPARGGVLENSPLAPVVFSDGQGKIWITDGTTVSLIAINDEGGSVAWTFDLEAAGLERVALFTVANGRCYCWAEWVDGEETITDSRRSTEEDTWGDEYYIDRIEVARGHSRFQGIIEINALTGAQIGRSDSGDEAVFEDYLAGPKVDSIYSDSFSYAIPRGQITSGEDVVDGPIQNLLDELNIPNYEQYFFRTGTYPTEEHDEAHNPYLTADAGYRPDTAVAGYSGSDPAAAEFIAAYEAIRDSYTDYQANFIDAACEARIQGIEAMRAQRISVNMPQHPLRNEANDRTYMDLTYTQIRPASTPPVTPPDDLTTVPPKLGLYFSADMTDSLEGRPFRPYPRVPRDYSETNQIVSGVQQRWAFFNEYLPYLGAEDLGPFEGLWSIESGDEYSGPFTWWGACGDAAEGETVTIGQSIIWVGQPEDVYERSRTRNPLYMISPCAFDGISHIHGPIGGYDGETARPAVWAKFTGRTRDWTYTHPGGDGGQYGTPIPLRCKRDVEAAEAEIIYFTFAFIDPDWLVIVLDSEGELVDVRPGVENMLNPVFTGDAFREGGTTWQP